MAVSGAPPAPLRGALESFLRAWAQVLFSHSPRVGGLLLLATCFAPATALCGAAAAALALGLARSAGLVPAGVTDGYYGTNALLVGLGVGATLQPGGTAWILLCLGVVLTLIVGAGLRSALLSFDLPVLTLPFLFTFPLVLGAAARLAAPRLPLASPALGLGLPPPLEEGLLALGSLFFVPRAEAGAMVLLALLVHSRVGTLLVAEGLLLAFALSWLGAEVAPGARAALGFNLALLALGAGGVWFVPGPASFLLAAAAALAGGLVTLGAMPVLEWLALPLLVLPFNVVMLLLLLAARQRAPHTPPAPAPLLGLTPEESLAVQRTRVEHMGGRYPLRIGPPFLGRWTCTQGSAGPITHRGPWTHAADFEVHDATGRAHRGEGRRREDWLCYHLPVVAPADGTVVGVRDGVPDNEPGATNLRENWGNVVVLRLAPGLYALMAHLSPHTIGVKEGQRVRRGEQLALCGSSGRSPTPHLHFQLQGTPLPGAPTLPLELHDAVVCGDDREKLLGALVPASGQVIRGLVPSADMERRLRFEDGERLRFQVSGPSGERIEEVRAEVDLHGARLLRGADEASMEVEVVGGLFTAFEPRGPGPGALDLLQLALGRVPLEGDPRLTWDARLPWRTLRARPVRWLLDAVSPFRLDDRPHLRCELGEAGADVVVRGESVERAGDGRALVRTRCVLRNGQGPVEVEVDLGDRRFRAVRLASPVDPRAPASPAPAAEGAR